MRGCTPMSTLLQLRSNLVSVRAATAPQLDRLHLTTALSRTATSFGVHSVPEGGRVDDGTWTMASGADNLWAAAAAAAVVVVLAAAAAAAVVVVLARGVSDALACAGQERRRGAKGLMSEGSDGRGEGKRSGGLGYVVHDDVHRSTLKSSSSVILQRALWPPKPRTYQTVITCGQGLVSA